MVDWRVVPISAGQRLDVREDDLLNDGLYRRCSTYRGGGGYDRFPDICERRIGVRASEQFIVQLYGCNLDCPYCYVTREGVWGSFERVYTRDLVDAFVQSGQQVFHLMGGAPALTMHRWPELLDALFTRCPDAVFHSDLMLSEGLYDRGILDLIARPRCLYAVNVKGTTAKEWWRNTRKNWDENLFWLNIGRLEKIHANLYFTFTGISGALVHEFWRRCQSYAVPRVMQEDHFIIDLIDYNAGSHVDDVPWGRSQE